MSSRAFERDGFTVIDGVITASQCDELAAALPEIETSGSRLLLSSPAFRLLAQELRTNPKLSAYIGDLAAIQCILFRKTREQNWAVHLHRDEVLPIQGRGSWPSAGLKEGRESAKPPREFMDACLIVRVHLDGAPTEDVSVVAGSHLDAQNHERSAAQAVPVSRGGALVMRPSLAHASSKLQNTTQRRVLHYLYAPRTLPVNYVWYDSV